MSWFEEPKQLVIVPTAAADWTISATLNFIITNIEYAWSNFRLKKTMFLHSRFKPETLFLILRNYFFHFSVYSIFQLE